MNSLNDKYGDEEFIESIAYIEQYIGSSRRNELYDCSFHSQTMLSITSILLKYYYEIIQFEPPKKLIELEENNKEYFKNSTEHVITKHVGYERIVQLNESSNKHKCNETVNYIKNKLIIFHTAMHIMRMLIVEQIQKNRTDELTNEVHEKC